VFQEEPGPILSRIIALKNDPAVPAGFRAAMTFVAPFLKTPGNILRQGAEFTRWLRDESRSRRGARGRAGSGSRDPWHAAAGYFAYLAATDHLSGNGPTEPGKRAALMEKGWRPNSVKIGNDWFLYNLFQPIGVAAAAVANAWERFAKSDRQRQRR
jgi:hypothetical protein